MKVSLMQENLAKALTHINKAVSNRPNIPVLANVLIEAQKGMIKLSSTNLEMGISMWIGANISEEGKLTVSAKLLSDFVSSLKPGKIDMFQKDNLLEVNSVDNKAEFYIIPADDFPKVPEAEGQNIIELNAFQFADAISQTAFAAGTDDSRPVLTGILMIGHDMQLTMVGVDGFRLSRKILKLEKSVKIDDFKEIVPAKTLKEMEAILRDVATDKDVVKIYSLGEKNQLLFKIGDLELSTRLIEGEYPDYEKILPKEKSLRIEINKEELANMLKVVTIFARNVIGNKTRFKVDVTAKTLSMSANVVDIGKNDSTIQLKEIEGDDLETGFNVKFLMDVVNVIKSEKIFFEANGPVSPGVFINPDDESFVHVVMPMRLD
jgi:DNA polymerase-3 subunit beta